MHIWYVHHYGGGPGVGLYDRPYRLARAWRDQGHTSTVFIAGFHHLLEKDAPDTPEFERDGVHYVRVPARPYGGNGVARMANIWDFTRGLHRAGARGGRDLPRPDAIVASSPHPFTIFPAQRIARRHKAKLVFEIRDIWPLSITQILGTSRLHPFVMMCAAAERFALTRSDLVASVLPRADRYLQDRGYGRKRFAWVPNGLDPKTAADAPAATSEEGRRAVEILGRWKAEGRTRIVYTGSIGRPNAIDLVVEAVAHAACQGRSQDCGLLVVGKGDQLEPLRDYARKKALDNVHFTGVLPKSDAVALLDHADVGYAGLRDIETLFKYGISPNKLADYYNAGLPVFLPIEPCGDPVSESGGGIARKAQTPEAVWQGLEELIALTPDERRALGARGKAYMAQEYDYARIARRYVEAIEAC